MKNSNNYSFIKFKFHNSLRNIKFEFEEFGRLIVSKIGILENIIFRKLNKPLWKSISVFVDRDYNLYGEPNSEDTAHQMTVAIEPITKLCYPYTDEQLESFLKTVFDQCFSYYVEREKLSKKTPYSQPEYITPIIKFMKAHSWKAAVKDLGLINIYWNKNTGYQISITWQNAKSKNSFDYLESDKDIIVQNGYNDKELAKAFRKAIDIVAIGPFDNNPYENE